MTLGTGPSAGSNLVRRLLGPDGAAPALIGAHRLWSREELADRVRLAAGALADAAESSDDRVLLLCANDEAFVVGYLSTLWAGLIAVPLNPLSPVDELVREADAVGATLLVTGPQCAALGAALVDRRATRLVDLEGAHANASIPIAARVESDPAALVFTTGTAGAPKPATLTHGSLAANLDQLARRLAGVVHEGDVSLGLLPFFHVFGLNVALGYSLAAGHPLVLVSEFHPAQAVAAARAHGVAVMAGVPAMYAAFLSLDETDAPTDAFASIRLAVSGGAALAPAIAEGMRHRFGVELEQGYGLTETSPVVATTVGVEGCPSGSIGTALEGVELRIVDVDGNDALVGDPGEVWVRGPNLFQDYWGDATATARVRTPDGWLRTGDLAVRDRAGVVTLVDRAKDLVIVSGFNVFPGEVEEVIRQHPDVAEAAVAGMPDERTGEAVVAWIVAVPGRTVDLDGVDALVHQQLARYKWPTRYEIVPTLPRTYIGKLLRRELREAVRDSE